MSILKSIFIKCWYIFLASCMFFFFAVTLSSVYCVGMLYKLLPVGLGITVFFYVCVRYNKISLVAWVRNRVKQTNEFTFKFIILVFFFERMENHRITPASRRVERQAVSDFY